MKKIIISICMLLASYSIHSEEHERKLVISADPVKAIHGSLAGLVQYKITPSIALSIPVTFGTNWIDGLKIKQMAIITDEKYSSSLLFGSIGLGARFLFNRGGFIDGFFAEPRLIVGMHRSIFKHGDNDLVNSNRITLSANLLFGYSWFWNNGLYISGNVMIGEGFHMKNDIVVDKQLANRLKDNGYVRTALSANESRWRFDYGYDISFGYSW